MNPLNILVGSNVLVPSTAPNSCIMRLRANLTYQNPSYVKVKKLGMNSRYSKTVCFLKPCDYGWSIPRGAIPLVCSILEDEGVNYTITKMVTGGKSTISERIKEERVAAIYRSLRRYQKECVKALVNGVQGHVILPCGSGKTYLAAAAALMVDEPTIVFVHTEDLMYQWKDTFTAMGVDQIGLIGGGNGSSFMPISKGQVYICMIQTMERNLSADGCVEMLNSAGCAILDEAHHCPAETFSKVIQLCPARYRWGLTATPDRSDGFTFLIPLIIGNSLYQIDTTRLVEEGYLVVPKIIPVDTGIKIEFSSIINKKTGRADIVKATSLLSANFKRNRSIVQICMRASDAGRKTLVIVPRVEQAKLISNMLKHMGCKSVAITSKAKRDQRKLVIEGFRSGKYDVLCATQLADEGLDLPILDTLVQASAGSAEGRAIQRVGRIMRVHKDKKKPVVFDLVDRGVFIKQWKSRYSAYVDRIGVTPAPKVPVASAMRYIRN